MESLLDLLGFYLSFWIKDKKLSDCPRKILWTGPFLLDGYGMPEE